MLFRVHIIDTVNSINVLSIKNTIEVGNETIGCTCVHNNVMIVWKEPCEK